MRRVLVFTALLLGWVPAFAFVKAVLIALPEGQADAVAADEVKLIAQFRGGPALSVGDSYMGLQYLLEGNAYETPKTITGQALAGGRPVKRTQGGPATLVLTPAQVRSVSSTLQELSVEGVLRRYDPMAMDQHGVEPLGWQDRESEGANRLGTAFTRLQAFYRTAAERGHSVLIVLTLGRSPFEERSEEPAVRPNKLVDSDALRRPLAARAPGASRRSHAS